MSATTNSLLAVFTVGNKDSIGGANTSDQIGSSFLNGSFFQQVFLFSPSPRSVTEGFYGCSRSQPDCKPVVKSDKPETPEELPADGGIAIDY